MSSPSSLTILNSHYETIVNDLLSSYPKESKSNEYLKKVLSHFHTVLQYNILDGKKIRGTAVIDTVRAVCSSPVDDELLKQAAILGWCIELMQAAFLVADDLMDHSTTRRGKPCWYLQVKEKESAINDSFYLYSSTFTLLSRHFPQQMKIYHLFHEIFQRTVIGQGLDLQTASEFPSIDLFTEEHYFTVVTWKTAYYTILLPILLGLSISPSSSLVDDPQLKSILLDIGNYFQVQDDYLDCYGDVTRTGKIGTDIQERKCSWLIVQAMQRLSIDDPRRQVLQENYGIDDSTRVEKVKEIYRRDRSRANLRRLRTNHVHDPSDNASNKRTFHCEELKDLLRQVLETIHARSK